MKKCSFIHNVFFSLLLMLVALVFVFLEGRLVFSGDWLLHEKPFLGFLQYSFRLILSLLAFGVGLTTLLTRGKKPFLVESATLVAVSVVLSFFVTNGFGLYFLLLSILFFLGHFFVFFANTRNHRESD